MFGEKQTRLKIAQIAPLAEAVPPKLYGGTERIVSHLTEALVDLGHDVTLFASGDSETRARLVPVWPCALRLSRPTPDPMAVYAAMLEQVAAAAARVRAEFERRGGHAGQLQRTAHGRGLSARLSRHARQMAPAE